MMFFTITLFIIVILLLPIPLKVTVHYSENNYYIKFYRFVIISKDGGILNKFLKKSSKKNTTDSESKIKKNTKSKINNKPKKKTLSLKALYSNIKWNKLKPTMSLQGAIQYSFNNAFIDSLSYGMLCNLNTILYFLLSIVFKVKGCNINFNPKFKDKIIVNITITSIITFSLVKIIYMLFLILKSRIYVMEVNP